ncbi:hypothetical protein GCM10009786_11620 [Leucobacter alluvii]|uniref:Carbohydrate kinase FGGY N-terminal domain-containing protein n=1 Tax=Leucobacter alluvii TaxID=340321 RepID=A0ABP5MVR8_9MICO
MTVTLGFDVGTTRTKALIYDTSTAQTLACVSGRTPVTLTAIGDRRDADEVWALLGWLCTELRESGAPLTRVSSISLVALGEEIVFLNERGLPTGPVACWYIEQPAELDTEADQPAFRLASWYAIRNASRQQDLAFNAAHTFTDLGSSLLLRMVGAAPPFMDRSHASRTGLLDNETGEWSKERLLSCGAKKLLPPHLVDSGTQVGVICAEAARHLSLNSGVPVGAGAHDHIAAALAAGVSRSGDMFVSVGTSESRLMLLDHEWAELTRLEQPGWEIGYFADGRHRYLHNSALSGKRVSELVADDVDKREISAVYDALTSLCEDNNNNTFSKLRSGQGVTADVTVSALYVELDHQASESAAAIEQMSEMAGELTQRIVVVGVPTQHDAWVQIRSERSKRPLEVIRVEEPAAIGAALLAAQAISDVRVPRNEKCNE